MDDVMESHILGFKSLLYPLPAVGWSLSFFYSKMGTIKELTSKHCHKL